jgi:hypothetical protein
MALSAFALSSCTPGASSAVDDDDGSINEPADDDSFDPSDNDQALDDDADLQSECANDRDCSGGERCTSGRCGRICFDEKPCPGGIPCIKGVCALSCEESSDCPGGTFCKASLCLTPDTAMNVEDDDDAVVDDDATADDDSTPASDDDDASPVDDDVVGDDDTGPCVPSGDEICDELDNDCNGKIDDTLWMPLDVDNCGACNAFYDRLPNMHVWCDMGRCKYQCFEGWENVDGNEVNGCEIGECAPTAGGEEICDNSDNNCDGEVDEGDLCDDGKICYAGVCLKG